MIEFKDVKMKMGPNKTIRGFCDHISKTQAIAVLRDLKKSVVPDEEYRDQVTQAHEAIDLAIAALQHKCAAADPARSGRKGGQRTKQLYTKDDRKRWGKMGGRPRKDKP